MRTEYIRIYKSVHTWTGIVCGMALFIAFYAGALAVFKEPIARWASPPAASAPVPLADVPQLIARTLASDPGARRDFSIHLHDAENVPGRMTWAVRDPNADDHDDTATRYYAATLDATGGARIDRVQPSPLADFIDTLHRVVGLPVDSDPNRIVMGVICVLYALALVSGVVILLPTLVSDFLALRIGRNLKRMWLDAHNAVGLVSLPFHVVMAITAVVFAFHDQIYDVQDHLVHGGKWSTAFQRPANAPPATTRDPAGMLPPADFVKIAREHSPGFVPASIQYQGVTTPRATVRVWGRNDAAVMPRARGGFIALDPYTGKVMTREYLPGGQDTPALWISSFFALHMAAFGGTATQWLYFLLGMAGAWLFYSGNLLWVEARRKRARKDDAEAPVQRLDTRLMAAATVGVCLGCVIGISFMMATSRWLHGNVANLLAWHQVLYYGAFFGCVAWAFAVGAGRASVHLLWCAAAVTLAMPLASLVAWLAPGAVPFANGSAAAVGVDVTALAGALGFAAMARATQRRVYRGPTDSVWSAATPGLVDLARRHRANPELTTR